MNIINLIGTQVTTMYVLIIFGYLLYKTKLLSQTFLSKLTSLLIWVINPMIILSRYQIPFEIDKFRKLGITFLLSMITMIFGFAIAHILKKNEKIEKLALGFGNAGFIGIPLITGILGLDYIFYLSAYLACFNLFSYTYGIYLITSDAKDISFKRIVKNPGVLAVILGIILFLSPIKLPIPIYNLFNHAGKLNTPIAMILLGTYIAKMKIIDIIKNKNIYELSFLKLFIIPVLTLILLKFIPFGNHNIKMIMLIVTATPVGLTVPMFSEIYGGDYIYGAKIVSLSTLLSLFSLPVILYLGSVFI